jgi:hypothetical protein
MTNPFENYPSYLKVQDIMEATQYGMTFSYELINRIDKEIPGSVVRGVRRGVRVHRDSFFPWFIKRAGMTAPEMQGTVS